MAKDLIIQEGDPVLRQRSLPVAKKDLGSPALAKIIKKMHAALKPEKYGVAIAAPQVGVPLRIFVVAGRVYKEEGEGQDTKKEIPPNRVYINPEITRASRKKIDESEGCLSVRSIYGVVSRHEKVTLKYITEQGQARTENASGLLGHIFQHEVDHLNGILFIDKARDLHESA
ncbi:MAG: peptide deformylase, peptide deformylase [Candidatus Adlerbacteria bacterium]|nr:peptide deformylase, peptide deformylase [Candidatus Adlerbacteria bacterium]